MLKAISLFSGIGGFDLGFERAGIETVLQVEQDKHCLAVLERHWPNVRRLTDVRDVGDWVLDELGPIDVIHGGPPCQPVSVAGQQRGIDDDRWLWDEVIRIVRELRPLDGRWFGGILGALAESGYDTEWDCIPAAAVGAPHIRDRVFLVAYPNSERWDGRAGQQRQGRRAEPSDGSAMADSNGAGLEGRSVDRQSSSQFFAGTCSRSLPGIWEPEPHVGRVAHGVPHRVDRLRSLGNAVVPQVAQWIGQRLIAMAS